MPFHKRGSKKKNERKSKKSGVNAWRYKKKQYLCTAFEKQRY